MTKPSDQALREKFKEWFMAEPMLKNNFEAHLASAKFGYELAQEEMRKSDDERHEGDRFGKCKECGRTLVNGACPELYTFESRKNEKRNR